MPRELVTVPSGEPMNAGDLLAQVEAMNTNMSKLFAGCTCSKESQRVVGGFQAQSHELERVLMAHYGVTRLELVPRVGELSAEAKALLAILKDVYARLVSLHREPPVAKKEVS